jgi:hypothetical protein
MAFRPTAANKTQKTGLSVEEFVVRIEDELKRQDAK